MSRRAALISEWRERLARRQADMAAAERDGQPRIQGWMHRAYARVLRFLLAQYGSNDGAAAAWTEAEAKTDVERPAAGAVFTGDLSGTPPKGAERIRAALNSVHAQVPEATAGPKIRGLAPDDYVSIRSLRSVIVACDVCHYLRELGIPVRIDFSSKQNRIEVPCRERERANAALDAQNLDALDREAAKSNAETRRVRPLAPWIERTLAVLMCGGLLVMFAWIIWEATQR